MGGVRLVTDSTSDLGALAAEYAITVIPLTVSFGNESFQEGVTIDTTSFFERLAESRVLPTTSQPAPDLFERTYHRLLDEGASGIVSIHISSKLSGTFNTARSAAEMLRDAGVTVPIEVIDSKSATIGMRYGILAAARAAAAGGDIADVSAAARDAIARTSLYMIADDLAYLQRGGRIGQAQRVLGTLLNVKPIITLRDGAVVALESPRTRRRAHERVVEYLRADLPIEHVTIGQTTAHLGDELEAAVRTVYDGPIDRMWPGPTIGTHVGPGVSGLALLKAPR